MKNRFRQNLVCTLLLLAVFLIALVPACLHAQAPITNHYITNDATILHVKIERSFIYVPDTSWLYSHHSSITHFKDRFVAIWSNGLVGEDQPGQRVVFSVSKDFFHWTKPRVLSNPSHYNKDTLNVLTAAGFHQFNDTLVAYYGEYSPYKTNQHLWARITTDGEHWGKPIDMHVPVNPNHGPQPTATGRLIISGNFTYPYTDDYRGLAGWKTLSFYPDSLYKEDNPETFYAPAKANGFPPLCETSFYQTDDRVLHALLRVTDDDWKGWLWQTQSHDNGAHWDMPVQSKFTDNDSKFHFGRLPNGEFYYVGIPDTLHRHERMPLVLSTSRDGVLFDKNYIIADKPYKMKKDGLYKDGQYGYPTTLLYGGYMYVIVSRLKEAVEVIRFKVEGL